MTLFLVETKAAVSEACQRHTRGIPEAYPEAYSEAYPEANPIPLEKRRKHDFRKGKLHAYKFPAENAFFICQTVPEFPYNLQWKRGLPLGMPLSMPLVCLWYASSMPLARPMPTYTGGGREAENAYADKQSQASSTN